MPRRVSSTNSSGTSSSDCVDRREQRAQAEVCNLLALFGAAPTTGPESFRQLKPGLPRRTAEVGGEVWSVRYSTRRTIDGRADSRSDFRRQSNAGTWQAIPFGRVRVVVRHVDAAAGQVARTWPWLS